MKKLFKTTLHPVDRNRLAPFTGNEQGTRAFLRTNPDKEDVQRLLMLELEREPWQVRKIIVDKLVRRIGDLERSELYTKIEERMNP